MMTARKIISLILALAITSSLAIIAATPAIATDVPVIERAAAAYVCCLETDEDLFLYNENEEIFTTSSTKIMTAILAIEAFSDSLDEKITVTDKMLSEVSGNRLGLKVGEQVTKRDLIYILVTGGFNDGAYCIAYTVAPSVPDFVDMMNKRAGEITGGSATHYMNPTGMHNELMKTTVAESAKIAKFAWSLPIFADASSVQKYVMEATNLSEFRNIYNRNCLISKYYSADYFNSSCKGINAGSTPEGGNCVMTVAKNEELSYLIIVMGAESTDEVNYAYANVQKLIDWAFASFAMTEVLTQQKVVCELPVKLSSAVDYVAVAPAENVSIFLPTDVDVSREIEYVWGTDDEELRAPLKAGDEVGNISAYYKGELRGSCKLVVTSDVEKSDFISTLDRIQKFTKSAGFIAAVIFAAVLSVAVILFNARRKKTRGPY